MHSCGNPGTAKRTVPEADEVIKELGPAMSNHELVDHLDTAGLRTLQRRDELPGHDLVQRRHSAG
jgi:hypothetical protein